MTDQDIAELQATLKHILELLQQMGYEVANNKGYIYIPTKAVLNGTLSDPRTKV